MSSQLELESVCIGDVLIIYNKFDVVYPVTVCCVPDSDNDIEVMEWFEYDRSGPKSCFFVNAYHVLSNVSVTIRELTIL